MHGGIPANAPADTRRYVPGDMPTSSVKRVAVRRFAVGEPELAAEMSGRYVRVASERLDVQRMRMLSVDPVANSAQTREVVQMRLQGGPASHTKHILSPARNRR